LKNLQRAIEQNIFPIEGFEKINVGYYPRYLFQGKGFKTKEERLAFYLLLLFLKTTEKVIEKKENDKNANDIE
jgi:hypothetical protein